MASVLVLGALIIGAVRLPVGAGRWRWSACLPCSTAMPTPSKRPRAGPGSYILGFLAATALAARCQASALGWVAHSGVVGDLGLRALGGAVAGGRRGGADRPLKLIARPWHGPFGTTFALAAFRRGYSVDNKESGMKLGTLMRTGLVAAGLLASAATSAFAQAGGHDQGRRPPFTVGHDGDQRDDPQGRHADDDRRAEQEGRPARARSSRPWSSTRRRTGRCSPRRRASCCRRRRSPWCSAAGPRSAASRCCRCSRS